MADGSVLLCDKPAGITSHDMVVRGAPRARLQGRARGTLDPFATGLLLVLLGRATRLQRFLIGLPKTYSPRPAWAGARAAAIPTAS